ncbi:helix-turn-helix transcriptional regulator [Chitinophaga sp. CC14]|uniref:helix-turn-helix domain-containing protein n=1 Tax=Chitinophaga TaxID=79328 RepID=UPI000DBA400E|nr:helix-turn-helix transcriptional regulator [Chitinophaga ginsengisegetis]MDR6570157.1 transcriptional regulator with XRE-family HTH domain [Chitinophaga ginsengisegetis]MDR6649891.1 transcriptional regulator with XRE-family HTH domain [Chitinophaga ginsengisegetis]MDR6656468.1 transcriptional regulator with XRE-family HTH domain [Chitinophaga ginsengisegetis]
MNNNQEALILLGAKLRYLRQQKGWSLRQMDAHCNIEFSNLGQIEKGKVDIRFSTIIRLAKVFNIPPRDLFDYPDQE